MHRVLVWPALAILLIALPASVAAQEFDPLGGIDDAISSSGAPEVGRDAIKDALAPVTGPGGESPDPPPEQPDEGGDPGFADRVRGALADDVMAFSLAGVAAVVLSLGGFALVTRYISPKEALKNPQRAMLYGFVRATPGAHLKQLSEEFGMKTSSILWHIRKLESAELVSSERVNGYRVFYPVEGGIEIKRVSRALAALQNDNALHVYQSLETRPGSSARHVSERLKLHGGTARWHLRKLRDHGLVDELIQEDCSRFYPTPLGKRALEAREGRPVDAPRPTAAPRPVPSE